MKEVDEAAFYAAAKSRIDKMAALRHYADDPMQALASRFNSRLDKLGPDEFIADSCLLAEHGAISTTEVTELLQQSGTLRIKNIASRIFAVLEGEGLEEERRAVLSVFLDAGLWELATRSYRLELIVAPEGKRRLNFRYTTQNSAVRAYEDFYSELSSHMPSAASLSE